MTPETYALSWSAGFVAGIAGSAHCFAMCGGMAGALGMRARAVAASASGAFANASLYHVGRLGGYALAGALCGLFGLALQSMLDVARLGVALRVASGVLLILIAIRLLWHRNALAWLERLGGHFWSRIQPLARQAATHTGPSRAVFLGLLWGWLPCGLVYSMLLYAAMSGAALNGAGIMLAFGLGTLPSMLTSTLLASQLSRWLNASWPRILSAALLVAFGAWMIAAALQHFGPTHHH